MVLNTQLFCDLKATCPVDHRVYYNGTFSNSKALHCGVPQGSCIGPLLFAVFTNDLPLAIGKASVTVYADDSTLHYAASTCYELNIVLNWIISNKFALNALKTVCMIFGSKHKLAHGPELKLVVEGQSLKQVNKVKLLGLRLDSASSWSDHIDYIVTKMGREVATTRKCSPFLPSSLLRQIVCSLVLCHLDYCSVIWSSASKTLLRKLQVAQNKAVRLVLKCNSRSNVVKMHERLKWLSVEKKTIGQCAYFVALCYSNSDTIIYF